MDNYNVYTFCHLGCFRVVNIWEARHGVCVYVGGASWGNWAAVIGKTTRDKSLTKPKLCYYKKLKGCALSKIQKKGFK